MRAILPTPLGVDHASTGSRPHTVTRERSRGGRRVSLFEPEQLPPYTTTSEDGLPKYTSPPHSVHDHDHTMPVEPARALLAELHPTQVTADLLPTPFVSTYENYAPSMTVASSSIETQTRIERSQRRYDTIQNRGILDGGEGRTEMVRPDAPPRYSSYGGIV